MFTCLLLRTPLSDLTSPLLLWRSCSRVFPGQLVVCWVHYIWNKVNEVAFKELYTVLVTHTFVYKLCTRILLVLHIKNGLFCLIISYSWLEYLRPSTINDAVTFINPTLNLLPEQFENRLVDYWYRSWVFLVFNWSHGHVWCCFSSSRRSKNKGNVLRLYSLTLIA